MDQLESEEVISRSRNSREKKSYHPEGPAVTLVSEPKGPEIKISDEQKLE